MTRQSAESDSLVDVAVEGSRLVATDIAGNTSEVDASGWVSTDEGPALAMRADETVHGRASELGLGARTISFSSLDEGSPEYGDSFDADVLQLGKEYFPQHGVELSFPDGSYRVRAETAQTTLLRIEGAFTLTWNAEDQYAVLSFPHPTRVTLGFRSGVEHPRATITVGPSLEDVATAVSHLAASHRTVDPERSFPTMRSHPPALELGAETEIPAGVCERTPDTGVELVVPPSMDALLTVAPLAYYLAADVRVGTPPRLAVPEAGYEHELDPMPLLQYQAAGLLRRTFALDCLVRNGGPWGSDLDELDHLERSALDLDVDSLYEQSHRERVVRYLDCDFARIDAELPAWLHWVQVAPERPSLESLPTMLSDLSAVFTPSADATGIRDATNADSVPEWLVVSGHFEREQSTPWTPGYESTGAAYRNRLAEATLSDDRTTVTVVAADAASEPTADWLVDRYERRLGVAGSVVSRRIRAPSSLADVVSQPTDLLHFVGECSARGLVCSDGTLAADSLDENAATQFLLDTTTATALDDASAVARRLVDSGSIAGVATRTETRRRPADEPAHASYPPFTVGGLSRQGFALETARRLAETVHDDPTIGVFGDGAYREPSSGYMSLVLDVVERDGDPFEVVQYAHSTQPGSVIGGFGPHVRLSGLPLAHELGAEWFRKNVLGDEDDVIRYDGDLYWPEDARRFLYPMA